MIRFAALALAVSALGACAATPASSGPARCDVIIKFASYGAGIDGDLAAKVATALKADRDVARAERKPWGKEGEFDQCLTAKPGRNVKAMFDRYRAMLPARSLKAPTSIEGPDGMRAETIGPM